MKVKFLGVHTIEAVQARIPCILVDGVLALDAGSLSSLSATEQLGINAILLTHQHYDHLRDIPIFGMTLRLNNASVTVYGPIEVQNILIKHLLNGVFYPRFLETSVIAYHPITPGQSFSINDYSIMPVAMRHSVPTVGYEIRASGRSLFYSSDTGPGLDNIWEHIQPDIIVMEVTAPNCQADFGRKAGHLTPILLKDELSNFQKLKGYIPLVYTVHMNPFTEDTIRSELSEVAHSLNCHIIPAHEGLEIDV
jgi:ribonuclease BN (tRNA processing enzyme)